MKVKFANTEVEIWKLRKGVVLGAITKYVHIIGITLSTAGQYIAIEFDDGRKERWLATNLEWLEPH